MELARNSGEGGYSAAEVGGEVKEAAQSLRAEAEADGPADDGIHS